MSVIKELIVKITTNAKEALNQVKNFNKEVGKTGDEAEDASKGVKKFNDETSKTGKAVGDAVTKTEDLSKNTKKAGTESESLKKKTENLIKPIKGVGDAMNVMKGALGAFGVTVGLQQLYQMFKDMADAAKQARDEYNKTKVELIDITGTLDQGQLDMVNKIFQGDATYKGFSDKSQVNKAVAYTDTFFGDGTLAQREDIARKLATMQATGTISDTASYAMTAKEAFTEWGISTAEASDSMSLLYSISKETKIPIDTLTNSLSNNAEKLRELGYGFKDAAEMYGKSFMASGSTKQMENVLSQYDTAYTDELKRQQDDWKERFDGMEIPDSYQKEMEDNAKKVAKGVVDAFKSSLTEELKGVPDVYSAYEEKLINNPTLQKEVVDARDKDRSVQNPSGFGQFAKNDEGITQVISIARSAGIEGLSQKSAIEWWTAIEQGTIAIGNLDDAMTEFYRNHDTSEDITFNFETGQIEEAGTLFEQFTGWLTSFVEGGLNPTNEAFLTESTNIGLVQTNSTLLNDYSANTLQPTLGNEKTQVDNLATSYWNLANAKKAAGAS